MADIRHREKAAYHNYELKFSRVTIENTEIKITEVCRYSKFRKNMFSVSS
jgi:hypothetical protein